MNSKLPCHDYWATKTDHPQDLESTRAEIARSGRTSGPAKEFLRVAGKVDEAIAPVAKMLKDFAIVPEAAPAPGSLPRGSLYLSFEITLAGPYISRDERAFHLISENPVKREWAFWVPMVSGTTWKGNVRSAAKALVEAGENRVKLGKRVDELFGPRLKDSGEEEARQGRVQFLPAYFGQIDADVINPRNRQTRQGRAPIVMERVPTGAKGRFGVFYLPYDLLHRHDGEAEKKKDLRLLGTSIASMLLESGFGGKKTLPNHGTAEDKIEKVLLADERGEINARDRISLASELWRLPELTRRKE